MSPQAQPSSTKPEEYTYHYQRSHRWSGLFWALWVAFVSACVAGYADPSNETMIWIALGLLAASGAVAIRSIVRGFQ